MSNEEPVVYRVSANVVNAVSTTATRKNHLLCVEVANDVLPMESVSAASSDYSRRQQFNSHEGKRFDEGCHGGIGVNDSFLRDKFE